MVGKIRRIALKDVWANETYDFAQWLRKNLDVLNELLNLTLVELEVSENVSALHGSIIAEDDRGNLTIIESQLSQSDNEHLGKIINYVTASEANTAVWVVSDASKEHIKSIHWLNESTKAAFYLVKVEAIQIGNSEPAPILTTIVSPHHEPHGLGSIKKEKAKRVSIRRQFWAKLLESAKEKTKLHAHTLPSDSHSIGQDLMKPGFRYNYVAKEQQSHVELLIDRGNGKEEESKQIFKTLHQYKEIIEKRFGGQLEWETADGQRGCRIKKTIDGGYSDEKKWPQIHANLIDNMINLDKAIKVHITKLSM